MELKNCRSKKKNLGSCMGFCDLVPRKNRGNEVAFQLFFETVLLLCTMKFGL